MYLPSNALDKLLTCQICSNRFDTNNRLPKILPCNETACNKCIQELGSNYVCLIETCKKKHTSAKSYMTNNAILNILQLNSGSVVSDEVDNQLKNLVKTGGNLLDEFLQDCGKTKTIIEEHYNKVIEKVNLRAQSLSDELNTCRDKLVTEIKEHQNSLLTVLEDGSVSNFIVESWDTLKEIKEKSGDLTIDDDENDRRLQINNSKDFIDKIEYMKDYLIKFKNNLAFYNVSSKQIDSSFLGTLNFYADNFYKIKYNHLNKNCYLKKPITVRNDAKLLWTRFLSKNIILNFYKKNQSEYSLQTINSNDCVLNEIFFDTKIDLCEVYGNKIVLCEDTYDKETVYTELKLYDSSLKLIRSKKFNFELKLHYVNTSEIFCWAVEAPHFRVFNNNLEEINSFGQTNKIKEKFYLTGSAYWVIGANDLHFIVGRMYDIIDVFCRKSGRLINSQRIEGLVTWSACMDSDARIIIIIRPKNLLKIFDWELNFLGENNFEFIERSSSINVTPENELIFTDYSNNLVRVL